MTDRTISSDGAVSELAVKQNAMAWALRTSTMGEEPEQIVARAKLYEEYVLGSFLDGEN